MTNKEKKYAIQIDSLNFSYTPEDLILENLSLEVEEGDFVCIVGSNGSGKSTLIKTMLGELRPQSGTIKLMARDISSYKDFAILGYVPQMSIVQKISFPITVTELVSLNLYKDFGLIKIPKKKHIEKTLEILSYLDLDHYKDYPVNELSGGLQQRVMIARALIREPRLLVLDEPTVGVDEASRHHFLKLIRKLNEDKGISIVLVTHEIKEALDLANISHVYELKNKSLERRKIDA